MTDLLLLADLLMRITCEGTGLSENKINLATLLKKVCVV
jgi:hypothetical protein